MSMTTCRGWMVLPALLLLGGAATCTQTSDDAGTIQILTVDDPFTMAPLATSINVDALQVDGGLTALAHGIPVADASITLGTYAETIEEAIQITGFSADGGIVAWGESLPIELSELAGESLDVFVQRTGMLSRLPAATIASRAAPLVTMLSERYVLLAGGTDPFDGSAAVGTTSDLYDLYEYTSVSAPPSFSSTPASMVAYGLTVLAITSTGAGWIDLSSADAGTATVPSGDVTWADIAGGATTYSAESAAYVVGATRSSSPTAAILVVGSDGTLSLASLNTPRSGATAVWVDGRGLLVFGGVSAVGTVAGAELLGPGATVAEAVNVSATFATGAGAGALDGSRVIIVGGTADGGVGSSVSLIDLSCTSSCSESAWSVPLPVAITTPQVFALSASSAFVLGDDARGETHAFFLTATTATEEPLRIARQHARGVRLPTGQIAVVGGKAQIESFLAPR